jgi:hypothetical protein
LEKEPVQPIFLNVYDWFATEKPTDDDVNGEIPMAKWKFLGTDGLYWEPDDDPTRTKHTVLDYFLTSMPTATINQKLTE